MEWNQLNTLLGGQSVIDSKVLSVKNKAEAREYLFAYGFDLKEADDRELLEQLRIRTIEYINHDLLPFQEWTLLPAQYGSLPFEDILIEASATLKQKNSSTPHWACIFLKVMHCAIHARISLNTASQSKAKSRMKERLLPWIHKNADGTTWIGDRHCQIPLLHFEFKENKSFSRLMTKLLHKRGNLALLINDHIGIRFVTYTDHAALLLTHFLSERHIVSSANIIPQHTKNSLTSLEEMHQWFDTHEEDEVVKKRLSSDPTFLARQSGTNPHSDTNFRMIKFVERVMIRKDDGRRLFFPFEYQVLSRDSWNDIQSGKASHESYKKRQMTSVRQRLFQSTQ